MKQCLLCNRIYTDEDIFCVLDGGELILSDEQKTLVQSPAPIARQGFIPIIVSVIIGVFTLMACGAFVILMKIDSDKLSKNESPNSPATSLQRISTVSDEEREALQSEKENLEKERQKLTEDRKKLETKKKEIASQPSVQMPQTSQPTVNTRQNPIAVIKTNDRSGLYFRNSKSLNSSSTVFAPEGAQVEILSCESGQTFINGRYGSWCWTQYNGTAGWAWSGFMRAR